MPNWERDDEECGCKGYGHSCAYHRDEQERQSRESDAAERRRSDDDWSARIARTDALLGGHGLAFIAPQLDNEPLFDDPDPEFDEDYGTHLADTHVEPETQRTLRRSARNGRALDRAQKRRCEACAKVAQEDQDARMGLALLQGELDRLAAGKWLEIKLERLNAEQVLVQIGSTATTNPELAAIALERVAALVRNIAHFPMPPAVPTAQRRHVAHREHRCSATLPRGAVCTLAAGHVGAHRSTAEDRVR